ncbi:MAG: amidohydrolase family protein [Acidobacteriota bacterium]|nr:amidohydrolase family protein [Blastocatellia bacterium]MDW8238304.1 amidohydrolase family protein [Acidobacteriota bacterium]
MQVRSYIVSLALAALTICPGLAPAPVLSEPIIALVGGTVIDGHGGPPLQHTVVIKGRKIAQVGRQHEVNIPGTARVFDVSGKFLLPGFIDLHVHYFDWMGELFLVHGVTTVKDVGNPIEWISSVSRDVERGRMRGPRILYVGYGIDAPPPVRDSHIAVQTPDMARRAVRLQHQRGATAVKVREKITFDLLRAITEEAHKLGMHVTGHIGHLDARQAALAGIDGLEHASGVVEATATGPIPEYPGKDDLEKAIWELKNYARIDSAKAVELVKFLAARNVALIPTMSNWWRIASPRRDDFARQDAEYASNPALAYVPEQVRQVWRSSFIFRAKNADDLAQLETASNKVQELLRQHHRAGGKVLAGSDTFLSIPGLSLHREMAMLVDAGFSPLKVISMATKENAQFMGQGKTLGTITPGKLADLVILHANPLDDIRHTQRIAMVIKDGELVDMTYHSDYSIPTPKPTIMRPNWLERQLTMRGRRSAVTHQP